MGESAPHTAALRRFAFDGVVIDEAALRLLVDGRPRPCSQRALRLLMLLCEAPGRTLSRQHLLDRLWPGGQIIGDEALTQAVFRARACLGRHADRIVTVRGIGFRLDAEVTLLDSSEPLPPLPFAPPALPAGEAADPPPRLRLVDSVPADAVDSMPDAAAVATAPSAASGPAWLLRWRPGQRWFAAVLLLALLAIGAGWHWLPRPAATVDIGFGLVAADLHASHPDTEVLLRDAFAHEGRGDRARARALLETAHRSDPHTPVPALFLALWAAGGGQVEAADDWLQQAADRIAPLASPWLEVLLGYIRAEQQGDPRDIVRYAGAALDLRPGAWQMRLARAHLLLNQGLPDAARAELAAIEIAELDHRKLVTVLADRASLGDVEGATAIADRLIQRRPPSAQLAGLRGRLAWSRGDLPAARVAYAEAVERSRQEGRVELVYRSLAMLGTIAVIEGRHADAVPLLQQARQGMTETGANIHEADLGVMLAQLQALLGAVDDVVLELDRADLAARATGDAGLQALVTLHRHRLGAPQASADAVPADQTELAALLAVHRALERGDPAAAKLAHVEAQRLVAPTSMLFDELRLLAWRVGAPVPEARVIDPPFPPLSRFTTRAVLAAEMAAAASSGTAGR